MQTRRPGGRCSQSVLILPFWGAAMSIDELMNSYRRYLMARIQEREFSGFGGDVLNLAKKTVREHREAEDAYVNAEISRRQAG